MTYEELYDEWINQPYEDFCTEKFEISDGVAIIPEGTTAIGNRAFDDCTSLESVTIPESVTEIGGRTFQGCTSLESIVIPKGVTMIGGSAFGGCISLTTVTLPAGVKKIEDDVFYECSALSTISVPAKKTDYYKKRLPEELHDIIVELAPEKKTKTKK